MITVNDFTPDKIGRGQWYTIHTLASKSKNLDERKKAMWSIKKIIQNLRCIECLEHATAYEKANPMEDIIYDPIAFFRWTYEFHKAADSYAGNECPSFEEVRKFYYENNEHCHKKCGSDQNIVHD